MHPKDAFKYCPSCGKDDLTFHDESGYLKCNTCGFLYFINAAGAVAALITDDEGRILLTKRAKAPAKSKLDLPGGFVDIGETAEHALEREIKEELNISLASYHYFMSHPNSYNYNGMTYFTLDLAFICKAVSLDNVRALDDVTEVLFINPPDIRKEQIGLTSIQHIIHSYQEFLSKNATS